MPKPVVRAVEHAAYRGLITAANVQAAGYVTHVALSQVAMLTAEKGRLIEQCPLAEPRFRVIVGTYAGLAAPYQVIWARWLVSWRATWSVWSNQRRCPASWMRVSSELGM